MKRKIETFRAAAGATFGSKKAQIFGNYLYEIAGGQSGTLTAKEILEIARPQGSPLHEYFNWDDTVAAENWRLHQARNLANHLILVKVIDGEEREIKAFFSVGKPEEKRLYVTAEVVAKDDFLRAQVVAKALSEVRDWQSRYKEYQELAEIFGIINKVHKSIDFQKESHI